MLIKPHNVQVPSTVLKPETPAAAPQAEAAAEPESQKQVRQNFQDAIAGTFYRTMLKALRSTEKKPAYMDGGNAEGIFKGQLDEQLSDMMAKHNGATFSDSLYKVMQQRWKSQVSAGEASAASAESGQTDAVPEEAAQPLLDAIKNSDSELPAGVKVAPSLGARSYTTASLQEPAHVLNLVG